jgi:hypothetical protein
MFLEGRGMTEKHRAVVKRQYVDGNARREDAGWL